MNEAARIAKQMVVLTATFVAFAVALLPLALGWDLAVVRTGSMSPAIPVGSVVAVDDVNPGGIAAGDVIMFRRDGKRLPVTHRVVEVLETAHGPAFRTKGDANEDGDAAPVMSRNVVGKVVVFVPHLGRIAEFIRTPAGYLALILIPGLLFLVAQGRKVVQLLRQPAPGAVS
jgi:signal peptidase